MADLRPVDDSSIPDEDWLYIRIFPAADSIAAADGGGHRPVSGSVRGRNRDEPLSIDLGSVCTPDETRDRGTDGKFHVARLSAGQARAIGLRVARDPIVDPLSPNLAHALLVGSREYVAGNFNGGLTTGERSRLARAARIVVYAPHPEA